MVQQCETASSTGEMNVLLADDDEINRLLLGGLADDLDIVLDCVEDGAAAVRALRRHAERYQLVLMDLQMPVQDGLSATREVRNELGLDIPIIALTASAQELENCRAAGMDGFLTKPVDISALQRLINHYRSRAGLTTSAIYDKLKLSTLELLHRASAGRLRNTVREAVIGCRQDFDLARQRWRDGDAASAAKLIHGYRGSLGTFARDEFIRRALELEHAVKQGEDGLEPLFDAFRAELDDLCAQLQDWLDRHAD
ncbi:response regulator [Chromobacterium phragmitis]|uniref:Response regulator n=1 Tax=Chromobacterium phragmitis TaxID=2202141 RepID=A0A344UD88_9NEIS|nr:response regulator [Chromobacterium phragmitis]AXE33236.1 hypothetical protein DK843_02240 [Chromobacterium phragmitis]